MINFYGIGLAIVYLMGIILLLPLMFVFFCYMTDYVFDPIWNWYMDKLESLFKKIKR